MLDDADNELEKTRKEAVVAQSKVLSQHYPGRTKENHGMLQWC
jgi:hypothetical protein